MFLDFVLFEGKKEYHTLVRPIDVETGDWVMKGLEFHFIELPKVRRLRRKPRTGLENFLYYFCDIGGKETMQTLAEVDWRVAEMLRLEEQFRSDPVLMVEYQNHEQAKRDFEREIMFREAESREEARKETLLATARRMRAGGLSDAQIAEFTGLSASDIEII